MMSIVLITSSLLTPMPTLSPGAGTSVAAVALRESLLLRPSSSVGTTPTPHRVVDGIKAAKAATRDTERHKCEAVAELHAIARTRKTQCTKLRELEQELKDKDGRITMLAAIVDTILA
jgi:hypothetical protein